jgi:hypothetical protein
MRVSAKLALRTRRQEKWIFPVGFSRFPPQKQQNKITE